MANEAPVAAAEPTVVPAPTISAEMDAASRGDFGSFQQANDAGRRGTPKPAVAALPKTEAEPAAPAATVADAAVPPAEAAVPPPADRTISKAQQRTNEAIRDAVARATAEKDAEIARLRAQQPTREPAIPAKTPEWKRYASMPDAPRLDAVDQATGQPIFASVEEHAAAMALFIQDQRDAQRAEDQRFQSHRERFEAQGQSFVSRIQETAKADPDFATKVDPSVMQARPLSALRQGEPSTFANVVAEAIWQGADPKLLAHLHADGDKAAREIVTLPPDQWLPALFRLDGRLAATPATPPPSAPPAAPPAPRSSVSAAPAPPPQVTGAGQTQDPTAAALARGDVATFQRLDLEERQAKRRVSA